MTGVAGRSHGHLAVLLRPARGAYGQLLLLIVLLVVGSSVTGVRDVGALIGLFGLYVGFTTFRVADAPRRLRHAGYAAGLVALALAVAASASGSDDMRGVSGLVTGTFTLLLILATLRDLANVSEVTVTTLAGLVAVYLLVGLMFGQLYGGIDHIDAGAFRTDDPPIAGFDLIYFSYITIATVGFGDITPAIDLTRALAVLEGVGGQLFLVTVVARVVSNMAWRRRREAGGDEGPGPSPLADERSDG